MIVNYLWAFSLLKPAIGDEKIYRAEVVVEKNFQFFSTTTTSAHKNPLKTFNYLISHENIGFPSKKPSNLSPTLTDPTPAGVPV